MCRILMQDGHDATNVLAAHLCFYKIEEDGGFVTQASKGEGLNHPAPPLWSSPVGSKDATTAAKEMRKLDKIQIKRETNQHQRGGGVWSLNSWLQGRP